MLGEQKRKINLNYQNKKPKNNEREKNRNEIMIVLHNKTLISGLK